MLASFNRRRQLAVERTTLAEHMADLREGRALFALHPPAVDLVPSHVKQEARAKHAAARRQQ